MNQGNGEAILTTPEAAERLGVSTARVRQLIWAGRLPSQQFGRDHVIKESDLALVAERKIGRPSKPKTYAEGQAEEARMTNMPVNLTRKARTGEKLAKQPGK